MVGNVRGMDTGRGRVGRGAGLAGRKRDQALGLLNTYDSTFGED